MWRLAISQTSQLELVKAITLWLIHTQPFNTSLYTVSSLLISVYDVSIALLVLIKRYCVNVSHISFASMAIIIKGHVRIIVTI